MLEFAAKHKLVGKGVTLESYLTSLSLALPVCYTIKLRTEAMIRMKIDMYYNYYTHDNDDIKMSTASGNTSWMNGIDAKLSRVQDNGELP